MAIKMKLTKFLKWHHYGPIETGNMWPKEPQETQSLTVFPKNKSGWYNKNLSSLSNLNTE